MKGWFLRGRRYLSYLNNFTEAAEEVSEDKSMAATTTTGFPLPACTPAVPVARASTDRLRRITPEAGRALEILGHAIEYLTDEFVHEGRECSPNDSELQAVQLLMALNRQIYFECPVMPTFGERVRAFFRRS